MSRHLGGALGWIGLAAGVVLAAQSPAPQLRAFRSGVDVVRLDVSVLDKDRRPVRDLTAKDFTITKVFTPEGKELGTIRQDAAVSLRPAGSDAEFDVLTPLYLKPGRYATSAASSCEISTWTSATALLHRCRQLHRLSFLRRYSLQTASDATRGRATNARVRRPRSALRVTGECWPLLPSVQP